MIYLDSLTVTDSEDTKINRVFKVIIERVIRPPPAGHIIIFAVVSIYFVIYKMRKLGVAVASALICCRFL